MQRVRSERAPEGRPLAACLVGLAALLLANAPEPAAGAAPVAELEGVRIGQAFADVDGRLDLRSSVPFQLNGAEHFILDTRLPLADRPRLDLERRGIRRMELRLRGGRVEWVRVEYAGRDTAMFDDVTADLRERYGDPARVQNAGPMQVGRARGVRLYLWLRIWTWNWEDRTLTVDGKHYGDDKVREQPRRHRYTYTLDAGPPPPTPESMVPIRKLPRGSRR